ncbi:MAG: S41 family peptidase [Verrucomicrobiota bacterium]|nr:S41 family peptidase [Verrucomicrobiota bacterium]
MSELLQFVRLLLLLPLLLLAACSHKKSEIKPAPVYKAAETFDAAWQIINDTHFDTNFNGIDWNKVRQEFRPRALAANSTPELRQVLEEMLQLLGHSHLSIIPGRPTGTSLSPDTNATLPPAREQSATVEPENSAPPANESGLPPFEIRIIEDQAMVSSINRELSEEGSPIKPGWVLKEIDGTEMEGYLEELAEADMAAMKIFQQWSGVMQLLKGPPGSEINITFLDDQDRPHPLRVKRVAPEGVPFKLGNFPTLYARHEQKILQVEEGRPLGYFWFNQWTMPNANAFNEAIEEFRTLDGMIIDLRGNVGGIVGFVLGLSGHLLTNQTSLGTMKMRDNQMVFNILPRKVSARLQRVEPFSGQLAILVDPISLSASELFAGGMQAIGRARIIGEPTTGQALPAIFDRLPNGDLLYHALADYILPNDQRLESRGVTPDVIIKLTRNDLLKNKDPVLQAAVDWIAKETRSK